MRLQVSPINIVVIDDYEAWRHFVASALEKRPELRIVGEAADGLEAVQRVKELQPDLILLDIGLPKLNGLEAARRIRDCAPDTRIVFFSQNRSRDVVQEAMRIGDGYVLKSSAASELLSAVEAVLQGKQFLSASLSAYGPPRNK
jgi:DNA-binding NarL/FixJ family response regulator